MSDNKFTRTGAGTWRLDGMGAPATATPPTPPGGLRPATGNNPAFRPRAGASGSFAAVGAKPASGSQPAHAPGASPSPPLRTPPRGLPNDPLERANFLGDLARKDIEAERWASAESNLLLALTWDSGNGDYRMMLDEVRRVREEQRKSAPKRI